MGGAIVGTTPLEATTMFVTRTALSRAGLALPPASAVAPEQDPRAWFESSACPASPRTTRPEAVSAADVNLTAPELERRFLACLCLPEEGVPGG